MRKAFKYAERNPRDKQMAIDERIEMISINKHNKNKNSWLIIKSSYIEIFKNVNYLKGDLFFKWISFTELLFIYELVGRVAAQACNHQQNVLKKVGKASIFDLIVIP